MFFAHFQSRFLSGKATECGMSGFTVGTNFIDAIGYTSQEGPTQDVHPGPTTCLRLHNADRNEIRLYLPVD